MDRQATGTPAPDRAKGGVQGRPKRNNAVMDPRGDTSAQPAGERGVMSDDSVARYLQAIEGADPAEIPEPAAALAELLSARLEGTDAPEARRILESFAAAGDPPSGEDT